MVATRVPKFTEARTSGSLFNAVWTRAAQDAHDMPDTSSWTRARSNVATGTSVPAGVCVDVVVPTSCGYLACPSSRANAAKSSARPSLTLSWWRPPATKTKLLSSPNRPVGATGWRSPSSSRPPAATCGARSPIWPIRPAQTTSPRRRTCARSSLPRFSGRSTAKTWLLSIARRVVVDQIRYNTSRPRPAYVVDLDDVTGGGGRIENMVEIRILLDGLDPERREALVLTQVLGMTYAEAAEVCGCPVGTIRSRVARARDDLLRAAAEDDRAG